MRSMRALRIPMVLVALVAALALCVGVYAAGAKGAPVGSLAPNFTLMDSDAQAFELREALSRGPVVLAFFPRAFSGSSIRQWSGLRDASVSFARAGVTLVGLSTDSMSTLKNFRAAHRLPFRLLSDGTGEVSQRYAAVFGFERRQLTAQKMVVIGRKGIVTYRDERYETKTETDLRALLRALGGD